MLALRYCGGYRSTRGHQPRLCLVVANRRMSPAGKAEPQNRQFLATRMLIRTHRSCWSAHWRARSVQLVSVASGSGSSLGSQSPSSAPSQMIAAVAQHLASAARLCLQARCIGLSGRFGPPGPVPGVAGGRFGRRQSTNVAPLQHCPLTSVSSSLHRPLPLDADAVLARPLWRDSPIRCRRIDSRIS